METQRIRLKEVEELIAEYPRKKVKPILKLVKKGKKTFVYCKLKEEVVLSLDEGIGLDRQLLSKIMSELNEALCSQKTKWKYIKRSKDNPLIGEFDSGYIQIIHGQVYVVFNSKIVFQEFMDIANILSHLGVYANYSL